MTDDISTPTLDPEPPDNDVFEEANWGVGWTRVNDYGDRISETTMILGSFAQAAFFAAKLAAEGVTVREICRWANP